MPTLDDIANEEVKDQEITEPIYEEMEKQPSQTNEMIKKILTSETGEGSIEDYIDHPMNFKKSQGIAQILRGVTGLGANLRLAIVDIGFGALRFSKERNSYHVVSSGGDLPS